jgi:hypothetical protein
MFVYGIEGAPGTALSTNGSANTESANLAIRQATRGVDVNMFLVCGRGISLTTLNSIFFRTRRWTTVGSGGTAITPAPRRIGTTASTTAADSSAALTAGTVSGAYQLGFGCGGAGPGGWTARDADSAIHIEGGSSDELDLVTVGGVASMPFEVSAEIGE